jgi:hypothetical protein
MIRTTAHWCLKIVKVIGKSQPSTITMKAQNRLHFLRIATGNYTDDDPIIRRLRSQIADIIARRPLGYRRGTENIRADSSFVSGHSCRSASQSSPAGLLISAVPPVQKVSSSSRILPPNFIPLSKKPSMSERFVQPK